MRSEPELHMKNATPNITRDGAKAAGWLSRMQPSKAREDLLELYPDGPLFCSDSPNLVVAFLESCADFEYDLFLNDVELNGVGLSIAYDFDAKAPNQLELCFKYFSEDRPASISTFLTCIKGCDCEYEVFGDQEFKHISFEGRRQH